MSGDLKDTFAELFYFAKENIPRVNKEWTCDGKNRFHDVTFCAGCVQLPEKSLEALCIHELTHSFVRGHDKDFHDKMLELGGQEMYDLDNNLWKEKRWLYLEV